MSNSPSQSEALERQLSTLGETDIAAAEIQAARGLAELLDSGQVGSEFWREYRFALKAVREALGDDSVDEGIADLLARLGGPDVRDTADTGS